MKPEEINKLLKIPEDDASSPIKTMEARFIYDFIRDKGLSRTLETGFAYGKSASHIMAATRSRHIAMDPFQSRYQNLGIQNIKTLGMDAYLTLHEDYSHHILPKLLEKEKRFDFIFIDGDHKFDGIFVDFYYADLLLDRGGFILLHDTWMRSTRLVLSFIKKNRRDYLSLPTPCRNLALFQKVGEDSRDGMHFKEFFTLRSTLSHRLILWMSQGKTSPLKRMMLRVKDKVK